MMLCAVYIKLPNLPAVPTYLGLCGYLPFSLPARSCLGEQKRMSSGVDPLGVWRRGDAYAGFMIGGPVRLPSFEAAATPGYASDSSTGVDPQGVWKRGDAYTGFMIGRPVCLSALEAAAAPGYAIAASEGDPEAAMDIHPSERADLVAEEKELKTVINMLERAIFVLEEELESTAGYSRFCGGRDGEVAAAAQSSEQMGNDPLSEAANCISAGPFVLNLSEMMIRWIMHSEGTAGGPGGTDRRVAPQATRPWWMSTNHPRWLTYSVYHGVRDCIENGDELDGGECSCMMCNAKTTVRFRELEGRAHRRHRQIAESQLRAVRNAYVPLPSSRPL